MPDPYHAVESFGDQVDEPIGVAGLHVQLGVALGQGCENRGKVRRAE